PPRLHTATPPQRTAATTALCPPSLHDALPLSTCTATVADTDSGTALRPGGTVTFTSSKAGTFSSGGTCSLPTSGTNSCLVSYTPAPGSEGANLITATYSGDTDHTASTGTDTVTGTKRPSSTTY